MIVRPVRVLQATRMISTLVGQSGREYNLQKVLQRHPKKPELSVCLALCDKTPYVVKPVSEFILEHLQEFRAEFEGHPRLRIHVDRIEKENILVYEYFKSDLLALVENYPPLPLIARKKILNEIGKILTEMHEKNWIHLDVKPDNIFLNCPEGHLGRGVGKPSEVFSFALLVVKENDGNGNFADWTEDVFPNLTDEAKRLILRMTNLDPAKRATMSEIVKDSYWVEDDKS
ncbi:hypothetical protein J4E93_011000 [Alternaria ventricosa]|uniref:uncharacterized protein n=1 Tax=Alternaria ventricosa TaxID=1187951 RepID=UPI0020C37CC4|nr:uncharacterized protein J4E93_011000 [Alternaria ventricosa]KAI4636730.1 hypothetical protein J4E93_011000 [Alternaria ventricosa]